MDIVTDIFEVNILKSICTSLFLDDFNKLYIKEILSQSIIIKILLLYIVIYSKTLEHYKTIRIIIVILLTLSIIELILRLIYTECDCNDLVK